MKILGLNSILIIFMFYGGLIHAQTTDTENQKVPVANGDTVLQLSNNIMVIYHDSKNNYWFGSWQDGLYKFDGKTILHFSTAHGLPDNRVEEIKEDKFGNVFINTKSGLCKFDGEQIVYIPETLPLMYNWILQPDDLWFKSTRSGHVCRYDGKSLISLEIPKSKVGEEYLAANPHVFDPFGIYCIYNDSQGNVWFGSALMGALRFNGKSFDWISEPDVTEMHDGPANGVRSIIEDKDGYFWFNSAYRYQTIEETGSNDQFYSRHKSIGNLDGKEDSDLIEYLSIAKDNDSNLWIATYRNGVWKYDGHEVMHYAVQENGKDINLFYIYKDNNGFIWLGTHENGAYRFNGQKFEKF